jgi:hypothetical protein
MEYNGFKYWNLSYLDVDDYRQEVSNKEGLYSWVFWPPLDSTNSIEEILKSLFHYQKVNLSYSEKTVKFKFSIEVNESSFPDTNNLFGLSKDKADKLTNYLVVQKNKEKFCDFFKDLCFSRPFYIGKATSVRKRLLQHITETNSSTIRRTLREQNINSNQIWIGTKELTLSGNDEGLSNIFEEILQRTIKPGLTKRPG